MKLIISQDTSAESPREWDNLGTIAYKHSRYSLGEEEIDDPIEWLEDILGLNRKGEYTNQRLEHLESLFYKRFIALPIYIYEHSNVALKTSPFGCRWDSGKVGYIYVSKENVLKEFKGNKRVSKKLRERVEGILEGEIETLSQYSNGEVYRFEIVDDEENVVDSCGGFYGSDFLENGMIDEIDPTVLGWTNEELVEELRTIEITY